ncbi:methyltransferase domain-containing protein [Streptomyces sp. NPDC091272]|uniref:methyltransferase domain-containing protein n=1 Tax=Streptomyces sp. NPDC091272 TaxID=3365981 RepID=UPI00380D08C8
MTANPGDERPGVVELGRVLAAQGHLSRDWEPSFRAVPRAGFLPELMWPFDMETQRSVPVLRSADPEAWLRYADSDVPVVTQWDDGKHSGTSPGRVATSSASMPSVVLRMLQDLAVEPGSRVLEIGTGTGWNAGLLAHRLGAGKVFSVEVDGAVAHRARAALKDAELPVTVVHGDGYLGLPEQAPFHRITATAGLRQIPVAWLRQCTAGAIVVAPWGTHYSNRDALLRLVVESGEYASGHFGAPVEFMKLRGQRMPEVVHRDYLTGPVTDGDESGSELTEEEFVGKQGSRWSTLQFALGLKVPDCFQSVEPRARDSRVVRLYELGEGRSWACAQFRDGRRTRVWQDGPRRLWDEVETAYRWWIDRGEPDHTRFGLTVTTEGQFAWLDTPDSLLAAPARVTARRAGGPRV